MGLRCKQNKIWYYMPVEGSEALKSKGGKLIVV